MHALCPNPVELIDRFLAEVNAEARTHVSAIYDTASKFEAGRAILELPPEQQVSVVLAGVAWQVEHLGSGYSPALGNLLSALLRKKLPFDVADLERLVRTIASVRRSGFWSVLAPGGIMRAVEDQSAVHGLSDALRDALEQLAAQLRRDTYYADSRKLHERVDKLLAATKHVSAAGDPAAPATLPFPWRCAAKLTTEEAWTRRLRALLHGMDPATDLRWAALLDQCATATGSKPSKKWLQHADRCIKEIGTEAFLAVLLPTLGELGKPGAPEKNWILGHEVEGDPTTVHDTHSDVLRGLVWCTSLMPQDHVIAAVGDTADVCFKKIPGVGPRAPKIGNACLVALSGISTTAAVAQLSRLKTRAKHVSIKKQLDKAFGVASEKTGMSAEDLEEVAVPTCGLTGVGELRRPLGEVTALLQVNEAFKAEVSWLKSDGKAQASVPASVKQAFAAEVKAIKQAEKEIDKLLPAQRHRLEMLFLAERSWSFADFRLRYLDHPLAGVVARRLIWRFTNGPRTQDGIWNDGRIVDERDRALDRLADDTRVELWHPRHGTVDEVKGWRDWLEAHEVRQPFKQAHREIYVLTDAERQTEVYSNRFAAHILKQHQFAALCQQRGWRYALQGEWDSANTPTLLLPRWDLRAEFRIEPIQQGGPLLERGDLSHMFVFLYVSTDQVRFCRLDDPLPLRLADVPPLVFSEVLRDLDLFVGVASIGNDPNWVEGREAGRYRDYWQNFSFGELFPSAQTRKAVLERLIPRLKIAERCTFSDRFLIVKGDLRSYKIHLGSGNILMTPNDQYLCITVKPGAASANGGKIHLPFEGDHLLSLIVSKAFMLAQDTKIKDPSITRQIRGPLGP
jgi:hypothetical protein